MENRRKQALAAGNVGGELIEEPVSKEVAAVKIQCSWRSKRVRRKLRRQNVLASVLQAVVRGFLTRRMYKSKLKRQKKTIAGEQERLNRLKRIKSQERELLLLKKLPGKDFLAYDKLKQHHSAKLLQRFWRGVNSTEEPLKKDLADSKPISESSEEHKRLVLDMNKFLQSRARASPSLSPALPTRASPKRESEDDEHIQVLKLAQLQRRLAEEAKKTRKAREDEQRSSPRRAPGLDEDSDDEADARTRGLVRRKKYDELLEAQTMSTVMRQEYLQNLVHLQNRHEDRGRRLSRVRGLLDQLTVLPSLDKSPLDEWFPIGAVGMSEEELEAAVDRHLQTVLAMRQQYGLDSGSGSVRPYRKWSLVTSPYDTLLAPMDVTRLGREEDPGPRRLARDWAQGRDAEESTWWVAYASQPPALLADAGAADLPFSPEEKAASNEKELTRQLVGHVDAPELLLRLARENIVSNHRKEQLAQELRAEELRVSRLAALHVQQVLEESSRRRMSSKRLSQSQAQQQAQHQAAARIQAAARGKQARQRAKYLWAEHRVVAALRSLVAELSRPELRGHSPMLRLDSLLMDKLGDLALERPPLPRAKIQSSKDMFEVDDIEVEEGRVRSGAASYISSPSLTRSPGEDETDEGFSLQTSPLTTASRASSASRRLVK